VLDEYGIAVYADAQQQQLAEASERIDAMIARRRPPVTEEQQPTIGEAIDNAAARLD
jgi:hypothetical protein